MVLFGEASGDGSDRRPGDIDPIDGSRVFSPGMQAAGRELLASGSVRARDEVFKEKLFSSYMLEQLASLSVSFFFGGAAVDGMTRWSVQLEEDRPCSRTRLAFSLGLSDSRSFRQLCDYKLLKIETLRQDLHRLYNPNTVGMLRKMRRCEVGVNYRARRFQPALLSLSTVIEHGDRAAKSTHRLL